MPHAPDHDALAGQLTAEHGHSLPPGLIRAAVDTALNGAMRDPLDAERTARGDVAALAAAARRSGR